MSRTLFAAGLPVVLLMAAAPAGAADPPTKPDVVRFDTSVRVEVDAAGKPVKVEASADLPQAIRAFVEKRVASWQYTPAAPAGDPVAAVTFVKVGACAVPLADGKGYTMGLDFKGNGPRLLSPGEQLPPPQYPLDARRLGAQGAFQVAYSIQPDGSARADAIEPLGGTSRWDLKQFRGELTAWVGRLHYEPEQLNGQKVATRMSQLVEFSLDAAISPSALLENYRRELQRRAIASNECIAAGNADLVPIPLAQDSPVTVIPRPAG